MNNQKYTLKISSFVLLFIFLFFTSNSQLISKNYLLALHRGYCISCKALLIDEIYRNIRSKDANTKIQMVITNLNNKQKKYVEKELKSIYKNYEIIYDVDKYYKNKYDLSGPFQIVEITDDTFVKYDGYDDFMKKTTKLTDFKPIEKNTNKLVNLDLKSIDSIIIDDDFEFVDIQTTYLYNNSLAFYDKILNHLGIYDLKSKTKIKLSLEDYVFKNQKILDSLEFDKHFDAKIKKVRFHSFINKNDNNVYLFYSIITSIRMSNGRSIPEYSFYEVCINNSTFISNKQVFLPKNYFMNGVENVGYQNDYTILGVYDNRYNHLKHNEVKDSTNIIIGIKDTLIKSFLTYSHADKIGNTEYGLFFFQFLYHIDKEIFAISPYNNLFLKMNDSKLETFLSKPKGILKTIVDTHSVIDKKQFLNGDPYKIKLDYSFLEFSHNKLLNCDLFLFVKPTEDINKKFLIQIYSENYFIKELEFNIDFEFTKSFLISNKDSSYIIFACENKTYIMELKL